MKSKINLLIAAFTLLFVYDLSAQTAQYEWKNAVLGGSGAVPSFYTHPKVPDLYFITTDVGTPYRWNSSIKGWEPIMMFNNIPTTYWTSQYSARCGEMAVDPNDETGNILYATLAAGQSDYNNPKPGGGRTNMGTLMKSTDRGNTWTDLRLQFFHDPNGNSKSFNNRLIVDPANSNNIWLATDRNGTIKSMDAGATWTKVNTGYPDTTYVAGSTINFVYTVRFLLCDPSGGTITNAAGQPASKVMYMGTINGVYRSEDAGVTFTLLPQSPKPIVRGTMHKDGTLFVNGSYSEGGTNYGAVHKYKAGEWTNITPVQAQAYAQVAVNPNNSQEIVASTRGTWNHDFVYRTKDGGTSWEKLSVGSYDKSEAPHSIPNINMQGGAVSYNGFSFVWDAFHPTKVWTNDFSNVVSTDDIWAASTSWKIRDKGLEEVMVTGKLVAPTSGRNELLTAVADVGGATYTDVTKYPIINTELRSRIFNGFNGQSVAYQENNPDFVVRIMSDSWDKLGRIYDRSGYSLDGGQTFTQFNENAIPGQRGRVHITNSGRIIWMTQSSFATASNSSILSGIYYSDNKGVTWTESKGITRGVLSFGDGGQWSLDPHEDKIAVDKVDPNLVYVLDRLNEAPDGGNSTKFYVSTDGGANFVLSPARNLPRISTWPKDGSAYTSSNSLQTVPGQRGHIWFSHNSQWDNAGIYFSEDAGQTFKHIFRDKNNDRMVPLIFSIGMSDRTPEAHLVLFSVAGPQSKGYNAHCIYRSDDKGTTWTKVSDPAPGLVETMAVGNEGRIYVGVSGNGVYYGEVPRKHVDSVKIVAPQDYMVVNKTLQLTANLFPERLINSNITWSSDDIDIATVDQEGLVTGVKIGSTTIRVTTEDGGKTDALTIHVTPVVISEEIVSDTAFYTSPTKQTQVSVEVLPARTTDKSVTWSSNDESIVLVDQNGVITGVRLGTTYLTVTAQDGGATKQIKVVVNNTVRAFNSGSQPNAGGNPIYQFTTIGQFEPEGPDQNSVPANTNNWHCISYPSIFPESQAIDISSTVNPAPLEVYRSLRQQWNNTCKLRYYFRDLIPNGEYKVRLHFMENTHTTAGKRDINIFVSNKSDSIKGLDVFAEAGARWKPITKVMKAKASNDGFIQVTFYPMNGTATTISAIELLMEEVTGLELNYAPEKISVGATDQLVATISPINATNKTIIWTSSDPAVIAVNENGVITGMGDGTAEITGTSAQGGYTVSRTIVAEKIPVSGITIAPADTTVFAGQTITMRHTFTPVNATNKKITWTSSNDSLASIDAAGVITANARGSVTITAKTEEGGFQATARVTIQNIPITNLTLSAAYNKVAVGATTSITAVISPVGATPKQLIWTSSNPDIATVDSKGVVTGVSIGTVTISATTQDEVVITRTMDFEVIENAACGLLQNSSFEADFVSWKVSEGPASNISITLSAQSGYKAAMINKQTERTTLSLEEPLSVQEEEIYIITSWMKLERTDNQAPTWAGLIITFKDASDNTISERRFSAASITNIYNAYSEQRITLAAPTGATTMLVSYTKTGAGIMYVDNVCVEAQPTGLWNVNYNPFDLAVTPNPVKDEATVSLNLIQSSKMRFRIYNLTGAVVLEKTVEMNTGMNSLKLETGKLTRGTYAVEAYDMDSHTRANVKIVK